MVRSLNSEGCLQMSYDYIAQGLVRVEWGHNMAQ